MSDQYRITERQLARLNELIGESSPDCVAEAASISAVIRSTEVLEWMKVTRDASGRWEEA